MIRRRSSASTFSPRRAALSTLRVCRMPTVLSSPPWQSTSRVWREVARASRTSSMSSSRSIDSICPRGVIVSPTVMSSSSKRLRKMAWCFCGRYLPPSSTRVRSSSMLSGWAAPSPTLRMRSSRSSPRTSTLTIHMAGRVTRMSGVST